MALRKTEKADLRLRYPLFVEFGMIITLTLLIIAFRWDISVNDSFQNTIMEQEVVQMEDIQQTQQIEKPPPPPRPPVPVEVPNDAVLEDDELDLDAFLDLDQAADLPPPPPPAVEDTEPEIFIIVEQPPELIGGLAALQAKIRYPEIAKKAGVEGPVFLQFIVDEEGNVSDAMVMRGIGAGCDEEAIKAILSSKFIPGRQRGKAVKVKFSLSVRFKLK